MLFLLASTALAAAQTPPTTCATLTAKHPGAPCSFDFSGFRPPDARLLAIESKGIDGSGLFAGGKTYAVKTVAELAAIGSRVAPGDQVVLADGTWRDAVLTLDARGTADRPIILRSKTLGRVVLIGKSSLGVWGANVIVYGLSFRNGLVVTDMSTVVQLGNGAQRPCTGCVVDRVIIDNYNPPPAQNDTIKSFYMILQGRDITVANSRLGHKNNLGTMVHAEQPLDGACATETAGGPCSQRLHWVGNVMSDSSVGHRVPSNVDKIKLMELGSSLVPVRPAYTIVERSVFRRAQGGTNTLVTKESDVIIRDNRFVDNDGVIDVRSSNRVLVQGNLFDGTNMRSMGGVTMVGAGHWVVGNHFRNLTAPYDRYQYPVSLAAGAYEDLAASTKDYARAKHIVIADNWLENVVHPPIALGVYPQTPGRALLPQDVWVVGNRYSLAPDAAKPQVTPATDLFGFEGQLMPDADLHVSGNVRR